MKKIVIVGGVAGGASCAARLRRLDGTAEIVLLERGPYISYANCGLPYHVGDTIKSRDALLVQTPEGMKKKFRIDVRVKNEVTDIDRAAKTVTVKNLESGETYQESYDKLVLATGSSPIRPAIPGIMLNGMFLITYTVLGIILVCLGFFLSYYGSFIFGKKLSAEEVALAEHLLRIMSINAGLAFPLSVFDSNVTINEHYLFQKIVSMLKTVVNPMVMIPLLLVGFRSPAMAYLALIITVITGIINMSYCFRKLRMPVNFRRYDFALLREMLGFTFYVFLGVVVENVNWSIDRLLLGWIRGTGEVTTYVVASQLNVYYLSFATAISNVLTPRVHRMVASNCSDRELSRLFTKVGRLQFILLMAVFLGFIAVGRPFVIRWGGGDRFNISYPIAIILMYGRVSVETLFSGC